MPAKSNDNYFKAKRKRLSALSTKLVKDCVYCGREHEQGLTDMAMGFVASFEKDRQMVEAKGSFLLVEEFLAHRANELLNDVDREHDKRSAENYEHRISVLSSGFHLYREMIGIMKAREVEC